MLLFVALLITLLFGCGTYLMLDQNAIRVVFGFALVSNGANLFVLAVSKDPTGLGPPLLNGGGAGYVDPLPQALVLTAIVIGFGMMSYFISLLLKVAGPYGTPHLGRMREEVEEEEEREQKDEKGLD